MANASIPGLPVAILLDGTEQVEIVQPAGSGGTSKRTTTAGIARLANGGTTFVGSFLVVGGATGLARNFTTNSDLQFTDTGAGGTATVGPISTGAITYAKIQQVPPRSLLGVAGNSTGIIAPIAGTANQVLIINAGGTGLGFGQINLSSTSAVTGTLVGTRQTLQSNTTFYVNPSTGNDSNNGLTPGTAFLTISAAITNLYRNIDAAGYSVTIQLADGTYTLTSAITMNYPLTGSTLIHILGNTTTPGNVILNQTTASTQCVFATNQAVVDIRGVKFKGTSSSVLVHCTQGSIVNFASCEFDTGSIGIIADDEGIVNVVGNYAITASQTLHILSRNGSRVNPGGGFTCTIGSALAFAVFAEAVNGGIIYSGVAATYSGAGVAGTTGQRYLISNGYFDGVTVFPGNAAGTDNSVASITTPGYVLQVNAGGTGLVFGAVSGGGTGSIAGLSVFGVTGTATAPSAAITGTASQILAVNAGATALVFTGAPSIGTSVTTPLIIGGTAASSTLTLRSTSGTGTTDAIIFQTGTSTVRGRITSTGNISFGLDTSPQSPVVISQNPTSGLSPVHGSLLHLISDNAGAGADLTLSSYNGQGDLFFQVAGGSAAAPTAVNTGTLADIGVFGHTGAGFPINASPLIVFRASEAWSTNVNGSDIDIYTTAIGTSSSNRAVAMRIQNSGGVSIGTTALDPGVGSLVANVKIATPKIRPVTNAVTGLQVVAANGTTPLMNFDTLNSRIGFGTETAPSADFVFSRNVTTGISVSGTPGVNLIGADGTSIGYNTYSYGGGGSFTSIRANGLASAKTGILASQTLFNVIAYGWDGAAYQGTGGMYINAGATNWTSTSAPTAIAFYTTPSGSNVLTQSVTMQAAGGVSIGSTVESGIGTLNLKKQAFSALVAATASLEGTLAWITDAQTSTFNAIMTTGGGTNHVLATCNGTNWVVTGGSTGWSGTIVPQVRVTLTSATGVMTTDVAAATTVYVTPSGGNLIPLYDGTSFALTQFAEVSQATSDATKSPAAVAANSNYDIFCWVDGSTNRGTRGLAWSNDTTRAATLTMVNGILLNTTTVTNGPAALRGTYVGTIRSNGSSTIDYVFGGLAASGKQGKFGVWNMYNRVAVDAFVGSTTTGTYTYATANTWRQAGAYTTLQINAIRGLDVDTIDVTNLARGATGSATTTMASSIGLDSITTPATNAFGDIVSSTTTASIRSSLVGLMGLGWHYVAPLEWNSDTGTSTWVNFQTASGMQSGMKVRLWL